MFFLSSVRVSIANGMTAARKQYLRTLQSSLRRMVQSAAAWSQFAVVLRLVGFSVVFIVGVRALPPEELGLWYTLSTIASLAGAIELGFHLTIARYASYFMAGQDRLQAVGIATHTATSAPRMDCLAGLLRSVRPLYLAFGIVAGINALGFGGIWLLTHTPPMLSTPTHYLTFVILGVGTAYNLVNLYWYATLNGVNRVLQYQQLTALGLAINYVVAVLGLLAGFGIVALAVGQILMILVPRVAARRVIWRMISSEEHKDPEPVPMRTLWPMTWRIGLATLATYTIIPSSRLLCAATIDLETTGAFGLSLQLALTICAFAASWFTVKIPLIAQWQASGRVDAIRHLARTRMTYSLLTCVGLMVPAWFLSPILLEWIGAKTTVLPARYFAAVLALAGMELWMGMHTAALQTTNRAPHLIPMLGTAVLTNLLAYFLGRVYGIGGLLAGYAIGQGLCAYWLIPILFWRSLKKAES